MQNHRNLRIPISLFLRLGNALLTSVRRKKKKKKEKQRSCYFVAEIRLDLKYYYLPLFN
jgi:hypothetical protein